MGAPSEDAETQSRIVSTLTTALAVATLYIDIPYSLAKKKIAIDNPVPLQPMDLFTEVKYTPVNPVDSEMEN